MKGIIIATALISLLVSSAYTQDVCSKLTCSKGTETTCATRTDSLAYEVNDCGSTTKYCPYLSAKWGESTTEAERSVSCQDITKTFKSYPGNSCTATSDCISGTCVSGICSGGVDGDTCENNKHYLCKVGFYCASELNDKSENVYVCRAQSEANECTFDYECPNYMGCAFTDDMTKKGKCLAYYSLSIGKVVPPHNIYSFCESGFAVSTVNEETKKEEKVCASLSLTYDDKKTYKECNNDDDCSYTYTISNEKDAKVSNTKLNNMCQCGHNNTGKKFCRPADKNLEKYDSYISKLKKQLRNPNCHTEERLSCSYIRNNKNYQYVDLYNTKVDVLKSYLFSENEESQSCLREVAYPLYDNTIAIPTCPAYSVKDLNKDTNVCMNSSGYAADKFSVDLSPCATGSVCPYTAADVFAEKAKSTSCVESPATTATKYPGEKCNANTECISVTVEGVATQKCESNVCVGVAVGKKCTDNKDCVLGSFCKTDICTALINDEVACSNSYQCSNNKFCLNNKCVEAFSQTVDTNVNTVEVQFRDLVCANNFAYNGYCSEIRYAPGQKVVNGVVECNYGDYCSYEVKVPTTGEPTNLLKECVCGYNAEGKGYCPYSINDFNKTRNNKIKDIYESALKSTSNHSLNRLNVPSTDNAVCVNVYKNVAYYAPSDKVYSLLINAECETIEADDDSSSSSSHSSSKTSGSYISTSFIVIAIAIFALFN